MSYEYSSNSQQLNFPNPLKLHNYFIAAASVLSGLTGLYLLFSARSALRDSGHLIALGTAFVAFLILIISGKFLYQLFGQLRFYFGRGRPTGLAPVLLPDQSGRSDEVERGVLESLRQQALEYREPADPLSGLLYSVIPNMLFAPPPVRVFAERQFRAAILTGSLMLGLLIALLLNGRGGTQDGANVSYWVALIFFLIALPILWRPKQGDTRMGAVLNASSVPKMVGLVCFSVLGPAVLSLLVTSLPPPPVIVGPGMLLLLLLLSAVLHGLFFAAVARHAMPAPSTTVSMRQDTWNLSCNPALVTGEFMRAMQEAWWEKIPNRRYCRVEPQVDLQQRSGTFSGSVVEETQPVPFALNGEGGDRPFSSGDPRLILAINAYALFMVVLGAASSIWLVQMLTDPNAAIGTSLIYSVFFWVLAVAGFDVARTLMLRFDFKSQLFWMELEGNYVAAEVAQGNRYTSNIHSSSQVVQVEGMTFRLWAAEAHTVTFGKDAPRFIFAMVGLPDAVAALADRLKTFATSQAALVSLGSAGDQQRVQAISGLNAQSSNSGTFPPGFDQPNSNLPDR